MQRVRTIVQLRRRLPLEAELVARCPAAETRPFQPGSDDAQLLSVNNSAFAWHPEQGGWSLARLRDELDQPWVDLPGLLVHEGADGRLDGFCWTRVHPGDDPTMVASGDPPLGEIYAIAADPSRHGTGLGTALVVAGLDHLSRQGLGVAMLYSEEGNAAARAMYDKLGFTVHERRGGFR